MIVVMRRDTRCNCGMPAPIPAMVNPALLGWAREQSGLAPEPVAKRLQVKIEKLLAWEEGETKPTVRQAKALAKLYHRPFGLLFLPQPPMVAPLAAEYRRLPGVQPGSESPELRLALRVMSQRRELALELMEELGSTVPIFQLSAHVASGPEAVGLQLREALGVSDEEQLGWSDSWKALRRWRAAIESVGALVFQFPKVSLSQVRGLSLLDSPLPAIGINSKEMAPGARVFTLLHELVHIALANGKDERSALHEKRDDAAWAEVERFAEEAASAALIPSTLLKRFLDHLNVEPHQWSVELMRSLAGKFRVTPLAMATRLRAVGEMSWNHYRQWKSRWNEFVALLPASTKGFATPVDKTLSRGGRPFTRLVLEAMDANRITSVQACQYLDLRFNHFDALRAELRLGSTRATALADSGE
jgi:Zn-dependent peptidase ImmA (M78 family)/transcriptional regulator with XRE-family HTH domain